MRIDGQNAVHQACAGVFGQFALRHGEDPVGAGGEAGVVGDQHHGGVLLAREVEHQLDDDARRSSGRGCRSARRRGAVLAW